MKPAVSVIIPVHNGERTIARAVRSALAQTYTGPAEIVVVNDGSTDATALILEPFADRVRIVHRPAPSGVAEATNAGVYASHGRFIAFLHADDEWLPEKLAVTVPTLEAASGAGLVYHDAEVVDPQGRVKLRSCHPRDHSPATLDRVLRHGWPGHPMLVSAVVMRRETFEAAGGFDPALICAEDLWMWLLALEQGPSAFVAQVLMRREFELDARRAEWYPAGARQFRRAVLDRYGRRAVRVDFLGELLACVGLVAMARGDRGAARACYLEALRNNPAALKNYPRLAWTLLPPRLARAASALLPGDWGRVLTGPPRRGPFSAESAEAAR